MRCDSSRTWSKTACALLRTTPGRLPSKWNPEPTYKRPSARKAPRRERQSAFGDADQIRIAASCGTMVAALRYLDVGPGGSNYRRLREAYARYGIPELEDGRRGNAPPPSGPPSPRRRSEGRIVTPLLEVLERGDPISQSRLRYRLRAEGIIEYRCGTPGCPVVDEWLGQPITLQLDHVNGDPTDNVSIRKSCGQAC
jgi:hypothetical protein